MDRTVLLDSDWRFVDGVKAPSAFSAFSGKPAQLPAESDKIAFTLIKKIICPKQVNDTVTVYFDGEFKSIELFAGKKLLKPCAVDDKKQIFDITPALKTGKTVLTAHIFGGCVKGFYLSVKRSYTE